MAEELGDGVEPSDDRALADGELRLCVLEFAAAREEAKTMRTLHPRWFVIRDGERAALLEDPRQEDMFWWSYAVTELPGARGTAYSPALWRDTFEVEDERSGVRIAGVYAGTVQPTAPGERVWLRGFRPSSDEPPRASWGKRLLSWFQRTSG